MSESDDFLLWSTYCCPALEGESFEDWLIRAKSEYQETFTPDCHPVEKGHGGYGLKPNPL